MSIIESINFLDEYWDECMEDQVISDAIENGSDILSLQEFFLKNFKEETKKEQYSQLEESINNINNTISSVIKSTNEAIDLLFRSQNEVNSISHINDFKKSEISQARTNIKDASKFYSYLDNLDNFNKNEKYQSGKDEDNFLLLDKLIDFRNLSDKLIKFPKLFQNEENYQFFLVERKKLDYVIENNLKLIKDDISTAFLNRQFSDNNILTLYRKYYTYIERLSIEKKSIQDFQTRCVDFIVKGILIFFTKNLQTDYHFNYEDKRIKEICELLELTPTSIPVININEDPLELRLIHFIVNLPQTIERCIYELYQVFRNNNLSTVFLSTLFIKYQESLTNKYSEFYYIKHEKLPILDKKSYTNSLLNESMYWCFIFATTSYHRITLNVTSRYINTIINIIEFTFNKSLEYANTFYSKYMDENYCPLKKLIFDRDKYKKSDEIKQQVYVKDFTNDLIKIVKDDVSLVARCTSIFYDMKGQNREYQYKCEWYNQTIKIQKDCNWFFHYNAIAEIYLIVNNVNCLYDVNDQKNLYFVNCMLYHYTKYSEGLRKSATDKFYKNVILKEVNKGQKIDLEPLIESQNIQMENVINIIFTYKQFKLEEAQKYMKLYIRTTAMFIHQKLQMIQDDIYSFINIMDDNIFILKLFEKKQENIKPIYDIIYQDCAAFLISKMSEIPKFIIKDNGKSVFDFVQFSNDIHQVLQSLN